MQLLGPLPDSNFDREVETEYWRMRMTHEMNCFVEAHDRYLALDRARTDCSSPAQREFIHIKILEAYLEVQFHARHLAGIQFADGNDYVDQN